MNIECHEGTKSRREEKGKSKIVRRLAQMYIDRRR